MQFRKDIWRPMLVEASIWQILKTGSLDDLSWRWLPDARELSYSADPFGFWKDGHLFVFFENFDYRTAHGTIGVHVLDAKLDLIESGIVLQESWHLSYPFVFEWAGDLWMLPEAAASGSLMLYRARAFPWEWEPAAVIDLNAVPIDATLLEAQGSWWMFYSPAGTATERLTQLHLAQAPTPLGPWCTSSTAPFYVDANGARPGGAAFEYRGQVVLPIQDCRRSYGSGLRLLTISNLGTAAPVACSGALIHPPRHAAPFTEGCHTLSGAGSVTLVDVKRRSASFKGLSLRPLRSIRNLLGKGSAPTRPVWI